MMEYKTPCNDCIHYEVCGARDCINETNVEIKTTHPYFDVEIKCTKFRGKEMFFIKGDEYGKLGKLPPKV